MNTALGRPAPRMWTASRTLPVVRSGSSRTRRLEQGTRCHLTERQMGGCSERHYTYCNGWVGGVSEKFAALKIPKQCPSRPYGKSKLKQGKALGSDCLCADVCCTLLHCCLYADVCCTLLHCCLYADVCCTLRTWDSEPV